jgi:uncharacterized tellurite resistance protein B-like protein
MDFQIPPPDKIPYGMRAMKTVALADGNFDPTERALMEAAQELFGVKVDIDSLELITPEELAREITDPQLRWQLCHGMIVMSLADGNANNDEWKVVEAFARTLDIESESFETLHKLADGHFLGARLDVARHFFAREKMIERVKQDGFGWLARAVASLAGIAENKELADKYRALESYPPNSLGKRYFEFIRSNGFQFPGERGGPPEPVILHDLTHTLGGYGTDPAGELQVIGFHAGYRKADPFTWMFFGLMQFHMGIRVGLLAKAETGYFNPQLVLNALARGAAMNIDLTEKWEPWDVMDRDIDELRAEYNIAPQNQANASSMS